MSWPPSWICFYCRKPINTARHFIETTLRTHYVHGGSRNSIRRFHEPCFDKFEIYGRPRNPGTIFELLTAIVFRADEPLGTFGPDDTPSATAADTPQQGRRATAAQQ